MAVAFHDMVSLPHTVQRRKETFFLSLLTVEQKYFLLIPLAKSLCASLPQIGPLAYACINYYDQVDGMC